MIKRFLPTREQVSQAPEAVKNDSKVTTQLSQKVSGGSSLSRDDVYALQGAVGNQRVSQLLSKKNQDSTQLLPLQLKSSFPLSGQDEVIQRTTFERQEDVRKKEFMEKLGDTGSSEQREQLYAEATQDIQKDEQTGFEPASDRKPTVERAAQHVEENPSERAFYIEVDVRNLGGLAGEDAVDERAILTEAAQIVDKHIKTISGAFVANFHHGGDEFSFVVVGASEKVSGSEIQNKINAAAIEFGKVNQRVIGDTPPRTIGEIPHTKNNTFKGTGIASGISAIIPGLDAASIFAIADLEIEATKKQVSSEVIITTEDTSEVSDDVTDETTDETAVEDQASDNTQEMSNADKALLKAEYDKLTKVTYKLAPKHLGGTSHPLLKYTEQKFSSFEAAKKPLHRQLNTIATLAYAMRNKQQNPNSQEDVDRGKFVKSSTKIGIVTKEQARQLYDSLNPYRVDPVTGFKSGKNLNHTISLAVEHVGKKSDHQAFVISAKLKNLAGLNKELGASGTNQVFETVARDTSVDLQKKVGGEVHVYQYRDAGGRFNFVLVGRPMTATLLRSIMSAVATKIDEINSQKVEEYNPTSTNKDDTLANQAPTGLSYGVAPIAADSDPGSVVSAAKAAMT